MEFRNPIVIGVVTFLTALLALASYTLEVTYPGVAASPVISPVITIEDTRPVAATTLPTGSPPSSPKSGKSASSVPKPASTVTVPAATQAELEAAAGLAQAALVNILCTSGGIVRSISGSGIMVDPRGIILTNAHIGQYFLFQDEPGYGVSCTIRTGGPARPAYKAKLIFISPAWIKQNAKTLTETNPIGTGERDVAFLAVVGSAASYAELPATFPFVSLSYGIPTKGEPVVMSTYAAQFLTGSQIQSQLYPTVVFGSIKELFTFASTTVDLVSLGGSAAAQEGSSGGGVINSKSSVIGIITTSTVEGATASRNVSAITSNYIARDYLAETGNSLTSLFAKTPAEAVADFSTEIPALKTLLINSL